MGENDSTLTVEDRNTATVRTVVPGGWGVAIAAISRRFGLELGPIETAGLALAAGTLLHRLSFVFSNSRHRFWRNVAIVLVGTTAQPNYTEGGK